MMFEIILFNLFLPLMQPDDEINSVLQTNGKNYVPLDEKKETVT